MSGLLESSLGEGRTQEVSPPLTCSSVGLSQCWRGSEGETNGGFFFLFEVVLLHLAKETDGVVGHTSEELPISEKVVEDPGVPSQRTQNCFQNHGFVAIHQMD